jgi:hypothetical protein
MATSAPRCTMRASSRTSEVVAELCRLRADVNHVDHKSRTPLHVVVCRHHEGAPAADRSALGRFGHGKTMLSGLRFTCFRGRELCHLPGRY